MGFLDDLATRRIDADAQALARRVRGAIRRGEWTNHTSGLADELVQGNVVILPQALADDFLLFCQRNPTPCPLLAVGRPGDPSLPGLGEGIDIRSDMPRYRVWRDGELVDEPTDIADVWRDELVTFVIGCSFSFEQWMTRHPPVRWEKPFTKLTILSKTLQAMYPLTREASM